jgi:hypothetical protein
MNIYLNILAFFENLNHLTIMSSPINNYPPLSLYGLPSTSFFSSTLTKLRIYVFFLKDCLALLDGRLKQLTTFIVEVRYISNLLSISYNMVSFFFHSIIFFLTSVQYV